METAKKLVAMVSDHKNIEAVESLYADDIVSVEAMAMHGESQTKTGKAAILGKNKWWMENHEVHSANVAGPWPHGDQFIVRYTYDVTIKAGPMSGQRMTMDEAALYTVKNGKIAKEEFFYDMGG